MFKVHERYDREAREREINNDMFARRNQTNPQALTLPFWEHHPVTLDALNSTQPGDKLLDFGCGTGEIDIHLARAGRIVTGLDLSPVALFIANRHRSTQPAAVQSQLEFQLTSANKISFPDHCFDAVLCSHVLEHIAHPTPVIKEIVRVLKPGGRLLLYVPRGLAYYDPTHVHFFEADTLYSLLENYFDDVEVAVQVEHEQLKAVCSNRQAKRLPTIICQMRIHNEDRWLRESFDSIALVADGIVILDDGSTDYTPLICREHPAILEYVRQDKSGVDEVRDKNLLLPLALKYNPDWVLCMDGDEVIEAAGPKRLFDALETCALDVSMLEFEFLYMWNSRTHYRVDGIYDRIFHPRIFRLQGQAIAQLAYFSTAHGGNSHGGSVPNNLRGRSEKIDLKILHLGYMYPEDRRRKYEWYKSLDPQHAAANYYEHLLDQPTMLLHAWQERKNSPAPKPAPVKLASQPTSKTNFRFPITFSTLAE